MISRRQGRVRPSTSPPYSLLAVKRRRVSHPTLRASEGPRLGPLPARASLQRSTWRVVQHLAHTHPHQGRTHTAPAHSPHHARGFDRVRYTTLEHLPAITTTPSTQICIYSATQHHSPTQYTLCPEHTNAHSVLPDLRGVANVDSAVLASVISSLAHVSEGVFVAQKHSKHWSVSARTVGFSPAVPGQNVYPCLHVFESSSLAISVGVVSVDMGSFFPENTHRPPAPTGGYLYCDSTQQRPVFSLDPCSGEPIKPLKRRNSSQ